MNHIDLVGRLAKDVELTKTQSGKSVARFVLAVKRPFVKDKTDYFQCYCWERSADYLNKYAQKGTMVSVEGQLETRSYESANRGKAYITEVLAKEVSILVSPQNTQNQQNEYQQAQNQQSYRDPRYECAEEDSWATDDFLVTNDDLPF